MGIKRTVSIRRIDLLGSEPLELKKIKQKLQKTEMSIFSLYFRTNAFVKKTTILDTVPGRLIQTAAENRDRQVPDPD